MNSRLGMSFLAALALAAAGQGLDAQEPPPIEHPSAVNTGADADIGLVPGLPLGPLKPDPAQDPVGFLDSGIEADHPQLKGLVVASRDFTGEGLQDDFHHGTIVALTFVKGSLEVDAAKSIPGIISAKVVSKKPVPVSVTVQRMIAAIKWLQPQHVRVVNISLALAGDAKDFAPLCDAIAAQKNILFVVAAGNGGPKDVVYPAECPAENKIVTGAVTAEGKVTAYSGKAEIYAEEPVAPVPPFDYYRMQGDGLAREGKYSEAESAYKKALASSPSVVALANIKYGLGFVALNENKPEEALQDFLAATNAAPQFAEAYLAASNIFTKREDFQAGLMLLQRGLAAGADSPRLRDRLARVLLDLDRPKEAQEQINVLEGLNPKVEGLDDLALAAHNRIVILDHLQHGGDPQQLFWSILDTGDGRLVVFLTRQAKVDVNAIPPGAKVPPLVRAAGTGKAAIVTALLRAGAKIDASAPENRITALMGAANAGDATIVQMLLDAGASIDLTDDLGFTPLMFTAEQGRLECAQILIQHGADPLPKSKEGKSAFDYARQHSHPEIAAELERAIKARHTVH